MSSIGKENVQSILNTIITRKALRRAEKEGLLEVTEHIVIENAGKRESLTRYKATRSVTLTIGEPTYPGDTTGIDIIELGLPCGLVTTFRKTKRLQNIIFGRAVLGVSASGSTENR